MTAGNRLRVGFLAGTLGQGGAEKQLVYMAQALAATGVDVRVYSLGEGEFNAVALARLGLPPIWIGQEQSPLRRLVSLTRQVRKFRPHVLQAGHFFTNLYVTLAARACGATAIGSIRSDALHEFETHGRWGRWLLRLPPSLLANSWAGKLNAEALGVPATRVHLLPNVIDLARFDQSADGPPRGPAAPDCRTVIAVGRLDPVKRMDRFLRVITLVRQRVPGLRALVVGDGPERARLESLAGQLGLLPGGVEFLGRRNDVPALLRQADVLMLSSDHEGFPNVILEAMAAGLPVLTTEAGDAPRVVLHGATGFVVASDDIRGMERYLAELLSSPVLRHQLGSAGRRRVEEAYSYHGLADRLLATYRLIGAQQGHAGVQLGLAAHAMALGEVGGVIPPDR